MARMRRHRPSRYIGMAYRINHVPGGHINREELFQTLYDAARMNTELPAGWDVTWRWQNSREQDWREAPFSQTVGASRAGFLNRMLNRLQNDAAKSNVVLQNTELREATPEEEEEIEETLDIAAQEGAYIGLEKRAAKKRTEAAERGAETRRRNRERAEREQAREHRKRSAAARKGWETRRRNERRKRRKGKR